MKNKRIISIVLCGSLITQMLLLTGCNKKETKIFDKDGNIIIGLQSSSIEKADLKDDGYRSYLEIVIEEAIQAIAENENCSTEEAEELIFAEQYQIHTAFDKQAYQSLKETYSEYEEQKVNFGAAVTNTKGQLIATYGDGNYEERYLNYATVKTPPYSSFKPLSVYAPALDHGLISWSKTYMDSPVKQVQQSNGTMQEWPANATNTYSNEFVCIRDAIEQSLNTVAVKCLQEYGVQNSLQYLQENYDISLAFEESTMNDQGEEEILGNIALGYLYLGVSPVDMAGYYQAFVNSGTYIEPKTVTKICDNKGTVLIESSFIEKRVMNVETAYVMNHLLQGVVSKGSTGEEAYCENVRVGGKTGTGEKGNWFVGFTPEYTCAIWHGKELMENCADEMFSKVVSELKNDYDAEFQECKTVQMKAYCIESGMLYSATSGCRKIDKGYYTSIDKIEKCNQH